MRLNWYFKYNKVGDRNIFEDETMIEYCGCGTVDVELPESLKNVEKKDLEKAWGELFERLNKEKSLATTVSDCSAHGEYFRALSRSAKNIGYIRDFDLSYYHTKFTPVKTPNKEKTIIFVDNREKFAQK